MRNKKIIIPLILAYIMQFSCTKMPDIKVENQDVLLAFPNPCINSCNINLYNAPGNNYTITVYKTNGSELTKAINLSSGSFITVDLTNEAEGAYRFIASNGTNSYSETLIKIKQ